MMEYIKSLKWTDYFFFCLLDPRRLVNLIVRKEGGRYLLGFIVVMVVSLLQIITYSLLTNQTNFFYIKISYGWMLNFLIILLQIVMLSALIDFVSQLRDHPGKIKQVMSLVNFSFFPLCFVMPLVFIFTVINFAPVFFCILFIVIMHIWQIMIIVQGISEIYQVSFGESLVIFLLPFIFVGFVTFLAIILIFINIFGYISNL